MDTLLLTLKALSDRNRMRIVAALLWHDELCGCQLVELLGVTGATASRHLSQMQSAGILTGRKDGRWSYFRLHEKLRDTFPLEWLKNRLLADISLDQDRNALAEILKEKPEIICKRQRGKGSAVKDCIDKRRGKYTILFLCTGNSCRSQMAEGWARYYHGDSITAFSAGIEKHGLNDRAVEVMAEAGVDISSYSSKRIDTFNLEDFDSIITVCDHAYESCPLVPAHCRVIHKGFDDPPRLTQALMLEEEKLDCYRKVRDEIKDYVAVLPAVLSGKGDRL